MAMLPLLQTEPITKPQQRGISRGEKSGLALWLSHKGVA